MDRVKSIEICSNLFLHYERFLGDTKPFDTYCNRWESSRLRHDLKYIGCEIEDNCHHDVLQYMERDLMALDGTMANEISIDKVSLLTLDEYRLYRKYLEHPAKSKSKIGWALLTAVSEYSTHVSVLLIQKELLNIAIAVYLLVFVQYAHLSQTYW